MRDYRTGHRAIMITENKIKKILEEAGIIISAGGTSTRAEVL